MNFFDDFDAILPTIETPWEHKIARSQYKYGSEIIDKRTFYKFVMDRGIDQKTHVDVAHCHEKPEKGVQIRIL